jgi:hypothetical protein
VGVLLLVVYLLVAAGLLVNGVSKLSERGSPEFEAVRDPWLVCFVRLLGAAVLWPLFLLAMLAALTFASRRAGRR